MPMKDKPLRTAAIQRYWFDETIARLVLEDHYGLEYGTYRFNRAFDVLVRSKRLFLKGSFYFTREDIDQQITEIVNRG